jgi:hypothetical protein
MALLLFIITSFLALRIAFTSARPHADLLDRAGCNIPFSSGYTCLNNVVSVSTLQGVCKGKVTAGGAIRFSIKYATAQRFQPPELTTGPTA